MSTFTATSNFDTNVSSSLPSEFPTLLPTSPGSDFAANTDAESYPFHGALEGIDEGVVFDQNVNAVHTHPNSSFNGDDGTAQVHDISRDFADWDCYNGYVSLGDITLNGVFGIRTPDPQQPWSLLDSEDGKVLQEYGNLNSPWCTHDVLAIKDSVGDLLHQDASDVDLWRQDQRRLFPDLVEEQDNHLQTSPSQCEPLRIVSKSTERQKRPQIVRDWLSAHASWPYPTPTEKSELIEATGYTELQLNNCLSNLRTREKYLIDSHAIGEIDGNVPHRQRRGGASANLSHVHSRSVATTHNMLPLNTVSPPAMNMNGDNRWSSPFDVGYPTPVGSAAFITHAYQDTGTASAYQASPNVSVSREATMPKRKGRRHRAQGYQVGIDERLSSTTPIQSTSSCPRESDAPFSCTVVGCTRSFKNASDWRRHEAGVHGHSDQEWICMFTDAFKLQSECVFCSEAMDSMHHLSKHAIAPCSDKCIVERTFFRKDLLKQHILHVHLAGEHISVRKNFQVPQDWSRVVESSAVRPDSCWCGFCGRSFESVAERMDHVAQHFREGLDMRAWNRI